MALNVLEVRQPPPRTSNENDFCVEIVFPDAAHVTLLLSASCISVMGIKSFRRRGCPDMGDDVRVGGGGAVSYCMPFRVLKSSKSLWFLHIAVMMQS